MRPQPRPFMVETKSRRRATQPENSASSTRREDWLVAPDDRPERDMKEDLGVAPAHEAVREAERVFARIGISEPVEANDASPVPVAIAEPARRVLPDLLAAAREQERANIQLPKTKRASTRRPTTQRRARTNYQPVNAVPARGVEQERLPVALPSGHAKAAIALSRRNPDRSKLPRGQRWKERRLPKVCWGRKLPRR